MNEQAPTYKNHRFPPSIIARAVWLYFRFNLSLCEVEEMKLERGVKVSYEMIRRWCRSHGSLLTAQLRRKTVIGPKIKSRNFVNQQTETKSGVRVLNEMTELGRPQFRRSA